METYFTYRLWVELLALGLGVSFMAYLALIVGLTLWSDRLPMESPKRKRLLKVAAMLLPSSLLRP